MSRGLLSFVVYGFDINDWCYMCNAQGKERAAGAETETVMMVQKCNNT